MTGRNIFRLLKPFIFLCLASTRIFPRFFFTNTWWLVMNIPGHIGYGFRYIYAHRLARSCGENVMFGTNCIVRHWDKLKLGRNITLHANCYIDAIGELTIGDNVSIAHATSILTFEHTWSDSSVPIKYNPIVSEPVVIEDDVWIACGVRILAGARLYKRSIVAAGAVVRRGEYPSGLYGGVPANLIRKF